MVFRKFGINFFQKFVVDVLHEVELGTFKDLFTHLVRICHSIGDDYIRILNAR